MKKNFTFYILIDVFIAIVFFTSCKSFTKEKIPHFNANDKVAHFDYFTYKGNDRFFNENKLPGNDYYYNPILPGWYSDPSICTNGSDFFMVTSTFSFFPGVPIFHSTDLVNWKQIGHVLDRPEQLPLSGQKTSEGIFAPAISYNPHNQTWYMITTNIKKGNFFVKTKDPFSSWSDPIWLPNVQGIDPSFFFDDDGNAYILNNDVPDGGSTYEGHRSIRIIRFDTEKDETYGPSVMLVNGGVNLNEKPIWIEGPHIYKINRKYYLMCAEGGTSINHREVIFRADSPMGEFIPWDRNPILTQLHLDSDRPTPITCAGHADLVRKDNGQWWSVFLACRPINNKFENLGRETFLLPVRWSEDGFPYITKDDEVIPRIIQMEGVVRDTNVTFGNFEKTDLFEETQLGMEWMTLRGPAKELYSLTENQGFLTLQTVDVASNELKEPAFVCRRLQHHEFECSTRMYFQPQSDNETAGILMYKDEEHQYQFVVTKVKDRKHIQLRKVTRDGIDVLGSRELRSNDQCFDLKVISDGTHFSFQYALGDSKWQTLITDIDAYYLSTSQSFGFTGTTIGLYATSK
nr:glycoside hydrolase family 43 protein [uncultured Carboxylicivirga sp.]